MHVTILMVSLASLTLLTILYLLDSLYARHWLVPWREAIAYIAAAALIGVFGEVFVETIYNFFIGEPLWHYQFLPVHATFTSLYAPLLWSMYGLHIYWVHITLIEKYGQLSRLKLASIFAVESLILETVANLLWLVTFGYLIYFYTPNDLWHVTTLVNIPCYFGASWAMIGTVKRFKRDPIFYTTMSFLLVIVFVAFP